MNKVTRAELPHRPGAAPTVSHAMAVQALASVDATAAASQLARELKAEVAHCGVELTILSHDDLGWWVECDNCGAVVVVLSARFVASSICEAQLTYAKDTGKTITCVVMDAQGFMSIMATGEMPAGFTDEADQIEPGEAAPRTHTSRPQRT